MARYVPFVARIPALFLPVVIVACGGDTRTEEQWAAWRTREICAVVNSNANPSIKDLYMMRRICDPIARAAGGASKYPSRGERQRCRVIDAIIKFQTARIKEGIGRQPKEPSQSAGSVRSRYREECSRLGHGLPGPFQERARF